MNKNITIGILAAIILVAGGYMIGKSASRKPAAIQPLGLTNDQVLSPDSTDIDSPKETPSAPRTTYTYRKHGFTMELPNGYVPREEQSATGPALNISLPNNSNLRYIGNSPFWVQSVIPEYTYTGTQKIGGTTFSVYSYNGQTFYWYNTGTVGYEYFGDTELLKTFKIGSN